MNVGYTLVILDMKSQKYTFSFRIIPIDFVHSNNFLTFATS